MFCTLYKPNILSEARQFGGKINKNDLPSLALKRQQKSFVMPQRQLKS